jgi:hypothetical protein
MNPNRKEVETDTDDLTQLLEIINAKGDEGELAEIVGPKRRGDLPKSDK